MRPKGRIFKGEAEYMKKRETSMITSKPFYQCWCSVFDNVTLVLGVRLKQILNHQLNEMERDKKISLKNKECFVGNICTYILLFVL